MTDVSRIKDDMQGLFASALEAYTAGQYSGEIRACEACLTAAGKVSSECETANNDAGFHAAEEVCRRIRKTIDLINLLREQEKSEQH